MNTTNTPTEAQVRDAAYALLVAQGVNPLDASQPLWSAACETARSDLKLAIRRQQQADWDALRASITFDRFPGDTGACAVWFNDINVGIVTIVDGQYGDCWEARDLDNNVVTVEVARIDAAAVLVEAHQASI